MNRVKVKLAGVGGAQQSGFLQLHIPTSGPGLPLGHLQTRQWPSERQNLCLPPCRHLACPTASLWKPGFLFSALPSMALAGGCRRAGRRKEALCSFF